MSARKPKEGRIHLRVPKELAAQMHAYAERHHIALNALTENLFRQLLEAEAAEKSATAFEAEQV